MKVGICPNCDSNINLGAQPEVGKRVTCSSCKIESIVVWLNPIELEEVYEGDYYEQYEKYYDEDFEDVEY